VTNANDDQRPVTPGHDRRAFLQRAGIGAVAVGAWVAPQVLFTDVASAGCTPITKLLQISACTCPSSGGAVTTTDVNLPACVPAGWVNGRNDGVTFTCGALAANPCWGGSISITSPGCGPTAGSAVQFCPTPSGSLYTCVNGTLSGGTITFPLISSAQQGAGCIYIDYRITVTCCT